MFLLLMVALVAWLGVALLPALRELRHSRDAEPFAIADTYREEAFRSPQLFAEAVRGQLKLLAQAHSQAIPVATLEDVFPLHVATTEAALHRRMQADPACPLALVERAPQTLPARHTTFPPVFASHPIASTRGQTIEALYGEGDVYLAPETTIRAWLHAEGDLTIGEGSRVTGSASAAGALDIRAGSAFERLHAPTIRFDTAAGYAPTGSAIAPTALAPYAMPTDPEALTLRYLVREDLHLPPGHTLAADVVVHGTLLISEGCHITGHLKAHGDLLLEGDVVVQGNLFAAGDIEIGPRTEVQGIVSAEGNVTLHPQARVGSLDQPTTVSGRHLSAAAGAVVHGTAWATEHGSVAAPQTQRQAA